MPFVKRTSAKHGQSSTDTRKIFIGRSHELQFFIEHILTPEDPSYNIVSISGNGGVGKSTLLARFIDEIYSPRFKEYCLIALVDEQQPTPFMVMEKFAEQLHVKGKFKKALDQYKEILRKQRAEREAPLETFLGKMPGLAGSIVKDVPFAGGFLKEGTEAASEFLVKKYRYHQLLKDTQQEEDPIGDLTKAFALELNQLANAHVSTDNSKIKGNRRVILFFDIFERLAKEVSPWLLDHFLEADISSNVVLVIAGRKPIEHSDTDNLKRWLAYYDNNVIYSISLNSFSYADTCTYLAERGINDKDEGSK